MTDDDQEIYDGDEDDRVEPGGVFEPESMTVWVMARKCTTCVLRPGNLMHLAPGRLKQMIEDTIAAEAHIVCHDTLLYSQPTRLRPAICRGTNDHPRASARSLALRTGRAMGIIRYQAPATKDIPVQLTERIAATGMTMDLDAGVVAIKSTGWRYRHWTVTYRLEGRTFETWFEFGSVDETPSLAECLDMTLRVARRVVHHPGYEAWASEFGGSDRSQWERRADYDAVRELTDRLRAFLGDHWEEWMHDTDTDEVDPAGDDEDKEDVPLCGPHVKWVVPDAEPDASTGYTTWPVLAAMTDATRVGGRVIERQDGYQGASPEGADEPWFGPIRPYRQQAIDDVTREYIA